MAEPAWKSAPLVDEGAVPAWKSAPIVAEEKPAPKAAPMDDRRIAAQMSGQFFDQSGLTEDTFNQPMTPKKQVEESFGVDPTLKRGTLLPVGITTDGERVFALPQVGVAALEGFVTPAVAAQGGDVGMGDVLNTAAMMAPGVTTGRRALAGRREALDAAGVPKARGQVAPSPGPSQVQRAAQETVTESRTIPKPNLDDFRSTNVSPTGPAVAPNTLGPVQSGAGAVPFVGAPAHKAATRTAEEGLKARDEIASGFGQSLDDQSLGDMIEAGLTRFADDAADDALKPVAASNPARMTSFKTKKDALYDDVERLIPDGAQVDMVRTRSAIRGVLKPSSNEQFNAVIGNTDLEKYLIDEPLTWGEARRLRTRLRTDLKNSARATGKTIEDTEIDSVYAAMTDDIFRATEAVSPKAAQKLKRADQFTAAGKKRIDGTIRKIIGKPGQDMSAGQVISKITQFSKDGAASADVRKLLQIRKSLRPEEWNDITASVIGKMGIPAKSVSDDVPFSVASFVTDWKKLSPKGRQVLFSNPGMVKHRERLESFVKVMDAFKKSDNFRSTSKSSHWMGQALFYGGVGVDLGTTASLAIPARVGTSLMMSPRFITWATQATRIAKSAKGPLESNPAWLKHMVRLETLASREPAVAQLFRPLSASEQEEQQQAPLK